jgi:hypothetical protein
MTFSDLWLPNGCPHAVAVCSARVAAAALLAAVLSVGMSGCAAPGPGVSDVPAVVAALDAPAVPPLVPESKLPVSLHVCGTLHAATFEAGGGSAGPARYDYGDSIERAVREVVRTHFPRLGPAGGVGDGRHDLRIEASIADLGIGRALRLDFHDLDGHGLATIDSDPFVVPHPASPWNAGPDRSRATAQMHERLRTALASLAGRISMTPELAHYLAAKDAAWTWPPPEATTPDAAGAAVVLACSSPRICGSTEDSLALERALAQRGVAIRSASAFLEAAWPWFAGAPMEGSDMPSIVGSVAFRDRMRASGLRYLVLVWRLGATLGTEGGIAGVGGFGAGGFFGYLEVQRQERADMFVVDLARDAPPVTIHERRDKAVLAVPAFILPVPIPLPDADRPLVERLADQIAPLIRNE